MKILMVCLGNICRSPIAEGIMQQKIADHGLSWEVDSAGTSDWHVGEHPDERAVAIAQKYGVDISQLISRMFTPADLDLFDRIYVMDQANYHETSKHSQSPAHQNKLQLIMNELNPGSNQAVPDPYWDDNGFDKVFQMLDQACERIIQNEMQKAE